MRESLSERQIDAAAGMFGALADAARLKTLILLSKGELSVSEVAAAGQEKISTVSARLQLLHSSRLVARERRGKSIIYRLSDDHVLRLVENAIEHACEHD